MDRDFRQSRPHVTDMSAVVREIRVKYPTSRLVLLGHSAGTVSAMEVALAVGREIDATRAIHGNPRQRGGDGSSISRGLARFRRQLLLCHRRRAV